MLHGGGGAMAVIAAPVAGTRSGAQRVPGDGPVRGLGRTAVWVWGAARIDTKHRKP